MLPWQSDGGKYRPDSCPPEESCRRIAQQKLRLPARFCYGGQVGKTVDELEKMDQYLTGFQKSHWLKGQLALLLDESLSAVLCGVRVTYSRDGGLTYEKEDEA